MEPSPSATTRDVVLTRTFDAPVEQVWKAWTQPELVQRWWGPTGFTAPVARMDVREGGRSLVAMRAPKEFGGKDFYNTWTYTKVEPHVRLEYLFHFTDAQGHRIGPAAAGIPPGVPDEVPHVVTFKRVGANRTEVTIVERGYLTDQARDLSAMGMSQCFDKMAAIFSGT